MHRYIDRFKKRNDDISVFTIKYVYVMQEIILTDKLCKFTDILNLSTHLVYQRGEVRTKQSNLTSPIFIWSACPKSWKWTIMYMCVRGFASRYYIAIWFLYCSDIVIYLFFSINLSMHLCKKKIQLGFLLT